MVLTGNQVVDALIVSAEATRQGVVNASGCTQASANTATIAFYKSVISAKQSVSPALDIGNEISAIQDQLNSSV